MIFHAAVKLALKGLKKNKKRAFMTMLGIVIGVGSVIIIMSAGAGAQSLIVNELSAYGSDLFGVTPGATDEGGGPPAVAMGIIVTTLKASEIEDVQKIPHVTYVTGYVKGTETIRFGNQKAETTFTGATDKVQIIEDLEMADGRFYTEDESKGLSRVIVLGQEIKTDLFGQVNAVGETVKLGKHNFKVIGVMAKMGTKAFENKDKAVYIPLETAQKIMLGINHISIMRGKVDDVINLPFVIEEVEKTIRENHNIDNSSYDDFSVQSMDQALNTLTTVTDAIRFFLAGIAAISLLVGGVGIMNIMLVSVTERTKEIGLRKSVGATRASILNQFLIESATLTAVGGIIGIIIGVAISWLIAIVAQYLGYKWDFIITFLSILLGLGISTAVGIIFGLYPANKASKMQPVEALRAE